LSLIIESEIESDIESVIESLFGLSYKFHNDTILVIILAF